MPTAPAPASPAEEHVLDESGHFHVTDAPIDLAHYTFEAWVAFAFFWVLAATIFYQFFTRYVLNDSAAWTEEIARYLLITVVFVGATIGVVKDNHIQVDFFYRFMPRPVARVLAICVDILRIAFFAATVVLTW